jgi:TrmH family RNA methyltransferase
MPAPPPESDPAIVRAICMAGNLHTLLRDLQRRKARERRGLVVAEGRRLVEDAFRAGARVTALLVADDVRDQAAPLLEETGRRGIRAEVAPRREFDALADTETPSGVLAVVEWRPLALDQVHRPDLGRQRALVIDGVQDPGNVGTMIRTAYALGAWLTVALDGTADVRGAKAVRGTMGALFRHQVAAATYEEWLAYASRAGLATWLAVSDGEPVDRIEVVPGSIALVIGNEGQGVREDWRQHEHRAVTVPMRPGAESLNAAVAAGILLFELSRADT